VRLIPSHPAANLSSVFPRSSGYTRDIVTLTRFREYRVDEDEIDERCDALRKKLLGEQEKGRGMPPPTRKGLKMHQVHELADAKIKESERLRQALKISKNYEEGGHWKRQEERMRKAVERDTDKDTDREVDRERD